jgi:hypothetical protein
MSPHPLIGAILGGGSWRFRRIRDAKNVAVVATRGDGTRRFVKIMFDKEAAAVEHECLLRLAGTTRRLFGTPRAFDLVIREDQAYLVLEHVPGPSLKQAQERRFRGADEMIARCAEATAELHSCLMRIASPIRSHDGVWNDWCAQNIRMFEREGKPVGHRRNEFAAAIGALIGRMERSWEDPLDVYKDANPANWIVSGGKLVAVDFETTRRRPWIVDLINVAEYAPRRLRLHRTGELLQRYIQVRRRFDDDFQTTAPEPSIVHIIAAVRHQEQVLHRSRDIFGGATHPDWHTAALGRHLRALHAHVDAIKGEKRPIRRSLAVLDEISTELFRRARQYAQ